MPYCSRCGNFEVEGSELCSRCGTPIVTPKDPDEITADLDDNTGKPKMRQQPAPPPGPIAPPPPAPMNAPPQPMAPDPTMEPQQPQRGESPLGHTAGQYAGSPGPYQQPLPTLDPPQRVLRRDHVAGRVQQVSGTGTIYETGKPDSYGIFFWRAMESWGIRVSSQMRVLGVFLLLGFVIPWGISENAEIRSLYDSYGLNDKASGQVIFSWDAGAVFQEHNKRVAKASKSSQFTSEGFFAQPTSGPGSIPGAFNPIFLLVLGIVAVVFAFAPTMKPQLKILVALAFVVVWLLFGGWVVPNIGVVRLFPNGGDEVIRSFRLMIWSAFVTGIAGGTLRFGKPGRILARVLSLVALALILLAVLLPVGAGEQSTPYFAWLVGVLEHGRPEAWQKIVDFTLLGISVLSIILVAASVMVVFSPMASGSGQSSQTHYLVERKGDALEGYAAFLMVVFFILLAIVWSIQNKIAATGGLFIAVAIGVHSAWLMAIIALVLSLLMGAAVPPVRTHPASK